jgi:hypothetical protein
LLPLRYTTSDWKPTKTTCVGRTAQPEPHVNKVLSQPIILVLLPNVGPRITDPETREVLVTVNHRPLPIRMDAAKLVSD